MSGEGGVMLNHPGNYSELRGTLCTVSRGIIILSFCNMSKSQYIFLWVFLCIINEIGRYYIYSPRLYNSNSYIWKYISAYTIFDLVCENWFLIEISHQRQIFESEIEMLWVAHFNQIVSLIVSRICLGTPA